MMEPMREDVTKDKPMTRAEMLDEVAWLLRGNVHPLLAAEQVKRRPDSIYNAARYLGHAEVMSAFSPHNHTKSTSQPVWEGKRRGAWK